jgi:hypothetical protein
MRVPSAERGVWIASHEGGWGVRARNFWGAREKFWCLCTMHKGGLMHNNLGRWRARHSKRNHQQQILKNFCLIELKGEIVPGIVLTIRVVEGPCPPSLFFFFSFDVLDFLRFFFLFVIIVWSEIFI